MGSERISIFQIYLIDLISGYEVASVSVDNTAL